MMTLGLAYRQDGRWRSLAAVSLVIALVDMALTPVTFIAPGVIAPAVVFGLALLWLALSGWRLMAVSQKVQ